MKTIDFKNLCSLAVVNEVNATVSLLARCFIDRFFNEVTINLLQVVSVDLPQSQDGRMKGFGYAEFEDRQALIDALSMNDGVCTEYYEMQIYCG